MNRSHSGSGQLQAEKALGSILRVGPDEFRLMVGRVENTVVVHARGGFFKPHHQYLSSYKGFAIFTKSPEPMMFNTGTEIVEARSIWIPSN